MSVWSKIKDNAGAVLAALVIVGTGIAPALALRMGSPPGAGEAATFTGDKTITGDATVGGTLKTDTISPTDPEAPDDLGDEGIVYYKIVPYGSVNDESWIASTTVTTLGVAGVSFTTPASNCGNSNNKSLTLFAGVNTDTGRYQTGVTFGALNTQTRVETDRLIGISADARECCINSLEDPTQGLCAEGKLVIRRITSEEVGTRTKDLAVGSTGMHTITGVAGITMVTDGPLVFEDGFGNAFLTATPYSASVQWSSDDYQFILNDGGYYAVYDNAGNAFWELYDGGFGFNAGSAYLYMDDSTDSVAINGALYVAGSGVGQVVLAGGAGTASVTGDHCQCTNETGPNAAQCVVSGGTLTVTGTGSDAINYFCY